MTQAIFGLVGVVIGGLISGGGAYVMARRAERRRARAAIRLVETELRHAATLAQSVSWIADLNEDAPQRITRPAWDSLAQLPPASAWGAYKVDLAEFLDGRDWYALADSYEAIEVLRHYGLGTIRLDGHFDYASFRETLADLYVDLQRGVAACAAVAGATRDQRPRSTVRSYLATKAGTDPEGRQPSAVHENPAGAQSSQEAP